MKNTKQFDDFLKEIRLTKSQNEAAKQGHELLRDQLVHDEVLKPLIMTTFLQGSYRRSTIVKPQGDEKPDVDLVVVGRFHPQSPPDYVLGLFEPFVEKHYPGKWERQGRSIGIKKADIELDLVVTREPPETVAKSAILAEAFADPLFNTRFDNSYSNSLFGDGVTTIEEAYAKERENATFAEGVQKFDRAHLAAAQERLAAWQENPLEIPDRDLKIWAETHPMAQMEWTKIKNSNTNGHFVDTVRAIKWLKAQDGLFPKYPKSYPLEHMVGDCCPDGIRSVAEGVVETLEQMVRTYGEHASYRQVPVLRDRGCKTANVMDRVDGGDFWEFMGRIEVAARTARQAFECEDKAESSQIWHGLFGQDFPVVDGSSQDNSPRAGRIAAVAAAGGFSERHEPVEDITPTRFA